MDIGNQIKKRRTELHMTQDDLATKLSVVRTTVSNWEVGRNYPDLQMIVKISDVLNVSLDQLLKGDEALVQQISEDTVVRKKQGRDIRKLKKAVIILAIVAAALIALLMYFRWSSSFAGYVSETDQIADFYISDDNILYIDLNLPEQIGVGGYEIGQSDTDPHALDISVSLWRDVRVENPQSYYLPIYTDGTGVNDYLSEKYLTDHDIGRICIVDGSSGDGDVLSSIELE